MVVVVIVVVVVVVVARDETGHENGNKLLQSVTSHYALEALSHLKYGDILALFDLEKVVEERNRK